jgi:hypothetical protein
MSLITYTHFFNLSTHKKIKLITRQNLNVLESLTPKSIKLIKDYYGKDLLIFYYGDKTFLMRKFFDIYLEEHDINQECLMYDIYDELQQTRKNTSSINLMDAQYDKLILSHIFMAFMYFLNKRLKIKELKKLNKFSRNIIQIVLSVLKAHKNISI